MGYALWISLFLQRLDPSHIIEVSGCLGGDSSARSVLGLLHERGLSVRGIHQEDQATTWDGLMPLPDSDQLFPDPLRIRGSTAALCLEPQQTLRGASQTLRNLREMGLRVLTLADAQQVSEPNSLHGADYVVAGPWDDLSTQTEMEEQAKSQLGSGVFLVSVCVGRAGVARYVRGNKVGDFSPWPPAMGTLSRGCLAAAAAAILHALRRNYDGQHSVELAAACGWLGSSVDDPRQIKANEIDILGSALRASRGLVAAESARKGLLI
jgi:sugar/nucleoside kinase (ribokinase family)